MILSRKNSLTALVLFISFLWLKGQEPNLFNEKNTAEFASYLFQTNQYKFAAEEYGRLIFMFPEEEDYQIGLLKSYRYANDFPKGILAYKNISYPSLNVKKEFIKLSILSGEQTNLTNLLAELDPETDIRNNLDLTLRLINPTGHLPSLEGIRTEIVNPGLLNLYYESSQLKHKSIFLAGTMSAIIPGTGKLYTGRWKDGLMSLVFVGTSAFQAYRGFEKKGVKSVYGWIMGGLTLGFYFGNIYGSSKSAKNYNSNQRLMYVDKVTHYYIDSF
jgi:hypothetical protein